MKIVEIPVLTRVKIPLTEDKKAYIELGGTVPEETGWMFTQGGFTISEYIYHCETLQFEQLVTIIGLKEGGSLMTSLSSNEVTKLINTINETWITKLMKKFLRKVSSLTKKNTYTPMNLVKNTSQEQSL